jgi:hypothetical protein
MKHNITLDNEQQMISVNFSGNVSLEERLSIRDQVLSFHESTAYKYIFLDMSDCVMDLSMRDIVQYIYVCRSIGKLRNLRISGVINTKDEVNNYIQLFLSSIGYEIHFFYQHDDAVKWLQAV